jgi:anti-anti-sigma regulatory factor
MPLRITQRECTSGCGEGAKAHAQNSETVLKVEGCLYVGDAELLEKICRDIRSETGHDLTLDLADLSFLDSESASVLCRLKREQGVALEGLHLFIAKVIELTEAEAIASEYRPKSDESPRRPESLEPTPRLRIVR